MSSFNSFKTLPRLGVTFYAGLVLTMFSFIVHSKSRSDEFAYWDMTKVIKRVYRITPEIKSLEQEVKSKYSQYRQAGKWPNPTIEIQSDNRLEKSNVENGYQTNSVELSQEISLTGRYGKLKKVAYEEYRHALEKAKWNRLQLEARSAGLYYTLQLTKKKLSQAKTRLSETTRLQEIGKIRSRVGDLSRFHRDRLVIVREKAHQQVLFLTTQYNDALNRFLDFLKLPRGISIELSDLDLNNQRLLYADTNAVIAQHPQYLMAKISIDTKRRELSVAKASRLDNINIRVFQEQDEFNNRSDEVTGIGIRIPLPIWNTRRHAVKKANAEVSKSRYDLKYIERDLKSNYKNRTVHLTHLIKQTNHYQKTILVPAKRVFTQSKRRFRSGDSGVLTLVDAVNTYFEARDQYLALVDAALKELIQYRLAAGISINPKTNNNTKGQTKSPTHKRH